MRIKILVSRLYLASIELVNKVVLFVHRARRDVDEVSEQRWKSCGSCTTLQLALVHLLVHCLKRDRAIRTKQIKPAKRLNCRISQQPERLHLIHAVLHKEALAVTPEAARVAEHGSTEDLTNHSDVVQHQCMDVTQYVEVLDRCNLQCKSVQATAVRTPSPRLVSLTPAAPAAYCCRAHPAKRYGC